MWPWALAVLLGSAHAREVNLRYLNSLLTPITVEGKAYTGLAIYADPDPKTPGQYLLKDAPGEGFVDLDDVARAVVVYARDGSPESLKHARDLLEIVLLLQTPDGEFYNFITREGRVNTDGQTSFKSAGFWAARAVWGLAEALPAFEKTDPAFAARDAGQPGQGGDGLRHETWTPSTASSATWTASRPPPGFRWTAATWAASWWWGSAPTSKRTRRTKPPRNWRAGWPRASPPSLPATRRPTRSACRCPTPRAGSAGTPGARGRCRRWRWPERS